MTAPAGHCLRRLGVTPVRRYRDLLAVDDGGDLSLGQPDDALVEHHLVEVAMVNRLGTGGISPGAVYLPLLRWHGPGVEVGGLLVAAEPAC